MTITVPNRKIALTFIVLSTGSLLACGKAAPKPGQVRSAVERYLVDHQGKLCKGSVTLDKLDVVRIAPLQKLGNDAGYPVFANFLVTCHDGISQFTYSADDGATTDAAVCWASQSSGTWTCAMPGMFAALTDQANKQMKAASRKMDEALKKQ